MSTVAPTWPQVRAQVHKVRDALHKSGRTERPIVVGLRAAVRWTGPSVMHDQQEQYAIYQCDSPLALRLALQDKHDGLAAKVLITPLADEVLEEDLLVRFAKRRLFSLDVWEGVKSLFSAKDLDPRVMRLRWLAERMLALGGESLPAVSNGFLDAETLWRTWLRLELGLEAKQADLMALLLWSLEPGNGERWRKLPAEQRAAATQWLCEQAGPASDYVLRCVAAPDTPQAVAVGLAAGVVFHPAARGQLERAAGRLERYFGGPAPPDALLDRWIRTATEVAERLAGDARQLDPLVMQADTILTDVQATEFAELSDVSAIGFTRRWERVAAALEEAIQQPADSLPALQTAVQNVRSHLKGRTETRSLESLEMAVRLVRWLAALEADGDAVPHSLGQAVQRQWTIDGFVDWARGRLTVGLATPRVAQAYMRLTERVVQARERHGRQFAELLCAATAAGLRSGTEFVLIEEALSNVVAPLARQVPVLLLVLDGMSTAVCRELLHDLTRHDWAMIGQKSTGIGTQPALALIPSVTEVCRTSLLCGARRRGSAADETAGFSQHAMLADASRSGAPKLFHKAEIRSGDALNLAVEVQQAVEDRAQRIVGVVINAVDDHLAKGEQLFVPWTRDTIKVLPTLLDTARAAGRAFVLASDHGHVIDQGAEQLPEGVSARWRDDQGVCHDKELRIHGERVLLGAGQRVIAPWSERVRYTGMQHGYHGGISPQEMVAPLVVLWPVDRSDDCPSGWHELTPDTPAWWDGLPQAAAARPANVPRYLPGLEEARPASPPVRPGKRPAWIEALFKSKVFAEQKKLAGRQVPPDEQVARILCTLSESGGTLTSAALARQVDRPLVRLPGLLAALQRLLNVEGYAVVDHDAASDTVKLNDELLRRQFELS